MLALPKQTPQPFPQGCGISVATSIPFNFLKKKRNKSGVLVRVQMTGRVLVSTRVSDQMLSLPCCSLRKVVAQNAAVAFLFSPAHPFPCLTSADWMWVQMSPDPFQRHAGMCSLCCVFTQNVLARGCKHQERRTAQREGVAFC